MDYLEKIATEAFQDELDKLTGPKKSEWYKRQLPAAAGVIGGTTSLAGGASLLSRTKNKRLKALGGVLAGLGALGIGGGALSSIGNQVRYQKEHGGREGAVGRAIAADLAGPFAGLAARRLANRSAVSNIMEDAYGDNNDAYDNKMREYRKDERRANTLDGANKARALGALTSVGSGILGAALAASDNSIAGTAGFGLGMGSGDLGRGVKRAVSGDTPYGKAMSKVVFDRDNAEEDWEERNEELDDSFMDALNRINRRKRR